ncbi:MAG TPA: lysylphosphatidylglycerol synthase transmembrane domain-containing protein [Candidatus Limnocylindrales bacterium]
MNGGGRIVRGLGGIAISVVALALVLRGVDLAETARVIGRAAPGWLALMLVFQLSDVVLRALRWKRLLAPVASIPYGRTLDYMLVGYLANNVLPARLGELVRSHYLGDREGISRTTTLGTVVVERVVDTTVLVLLASAAILVLRVRGIVASAVLVGLAVSGLLVVALALALLAHRLPGGDRLVALVRRNPRIAELGRRLRGGLAVASEPRTLVAAVLLSLGAWAASVLAVAAAGQAVGVQLTTAQAALLGAGTALSTAIPSGPGYLGTYELAAVSIGAVIGLSSETAFAIALIGHATIIVVTSLGGSVAFLRIWRRASARGRSETAEPLRTAP